MRTSLSSADFPAERGSGAWFETPNELAADGFCRAPRRCQDRIWSEWTQGLQFKQRFRSSVPGTNAALRRLRFSCVLKDCFSLLDDSTALEYLPASPSLRRDVKFLRMLFRAARRDALVADGPAEFVDTVLAPYSLARSAADAKRARNR
jgi:hypothetical protein